MLLKLQTLLFLALFICLGSTKRVRYGSHTTEASTNHESHQVDESQEKEPENKNYYSFLDQNAKRQRVKYNTGKDGVKATADLYSEVKLGTTKLSNGDQFHQNEDNDANDSQDISNHKQSSSDYKQFQHNPPKDYKISEVTPPKHKYLSGRPNHDISSNVKHSASNAHVVSTKFAVNHESYDGQQPYEPFTEYKGRVQDDYKPISEFKTTSEYKLPSKYSNFKSNNNFKPSQFSDLQTFQGPSAESFAPEQKYQSHSFGSSKYKPFKLSSHHPIASQSEDHHVANIKPLLSHLSFDHSSQYSKPHEFDFKPSFKLQDVPNLYPESESSFKPIAASKGQIQRYIEDQKRQQNKIIEQQLLNNPNPAAKGQYNQFLKAQEDEAIEQQYIQEQYRPKVVYKARPSNHHPVLRKAPSRPITLGLGHFRAPPGAQLPFTIKFNI